MKNLILAIVAAFTIVGTAYAETRTIPVEPDPSGISWKDGNRFVIYWNDGCRIHKDGVMPKRICENPAFYFLDKYYKQDMYNDPKTQYPATKLWINGVKIKRWSPLNKYTPVEQIEQDRLLKGYLDGGFLSARFLIYETDSDSITVSSILETSEDAFEEYLSLKEIVFNEWKDKAIRTYFFWGVGIVGGLVSIYLLIVIFMKLTNIRKSLSQRSKEKKHEAMVQRITEEETIRREVRRSLEAEE